MPKSKHTTPLLPDEVQSNFAATRGPKRRIGLNGNTHIQLTVEMMGRLNVIAGELHKTIGIRPQPRQVVEWLVTQWEVKHPKE